MLNILSRCYCTDISTTYTPQYFRTHPIVVCTYTLPSAIDFESIELRAPQVNECVTVNVLFNYTEQRAWLEAFYGDKSCTDWTEWRTSRFFREEEISVLLDILNRSLSVHGWSLSEWVACALLSERSLN